MGQAVLEQRRLVSDLLAVSTFDHACKEALTEGADSVQFTSLSVAKRPLCRVSWLPIAVNANNTSQGTSA